MKIGLCCRICFPTNTRVWWFDDGWDFASFSAGLSLPLFNLRISQTHQLAGWYAWLCRPGQWSPRLLETRDEWLVYWWLRYTDEDAADIKKQGRIYGVPGPPFGGEKFVIKFNVKKNKFMLNLNTFENVHVNCIPFRFLNTPLYRRCAYVYWSSY